MKFNEKIKKQKNKTNKVTKRMLFNKTVQYYIQIFNKIIFFKYRTREIKAIEKNKKINETKSNIQESY